MTTRFNTCVLLLARNIYEVRMDAYDLRDQRPFEELEPTQKAVYVGQAQQILNANRPLVVDTFGGGHASS